MSFFLQSNLRIRVNYFSVIDKNNQINFFFFFLHFHPCFTFEFLHSAVIISYQNSSSQCMNFKRRGLAGKSAAILVSLYCNTHPVLEIQTQRCHESRTGLLRKSLLNICAAGLFPKTPTERVNCSLISMILLNFRETSTIVIVVINNISNVA